MSDVSDSCANHNGDGKRKQEDQETDVLEDHLTWGSDTQSEDSWGTGIDESEAAAHDTDDEKETEKKSDLAGSTNDFAPENCVVQREANCVVQTIRAFFELTPEEHGLRTFSTHNTFATAIYRNCLCVFDTDGVCWSILSSKGALTIANDLANVLRPTDAIMLNFNRSGSNPTNAFVFFRPSNDTTAEPQQPLESFERCYKIPATSPRVVSGDFAIAFSQTFLERYAKKHKLT